MKVGGKTFIIEDIVAWLNETTGRVNGFLGAVFHVLNQTLKPTPVQQVCGIRRATSAVCRPNHESALLIVVNASRTDGLRSLKTRPVLSRKDAAPTGGKSRPFSDLAEAAECDFRPRLPALRQIAPARPKT